MTDLIVHPSKLFGKIEVPSSKSHSIRAIILASLAHGTSTIYKRLNSPDIHHTIKACRMFGANIEERGEDLVIVGTGGVFHSPKEPMDSGNSGQILRFIGALAALSSQETILTGDDSIQTRRPVKPMLEALKQLGAKAVSLKGNDLAPIKIQGPAKPGHTSLIGHDSQPVSGMILLAAFLEGVTDIKVSEPGEKPWIDLTLYWLDKLKVAYENHHYEHYKIYGRRDIHAFSYQVAADFSSAAYPMAAALLSRSSVVLSNMDMQDPQGDKKIIEAYRAMGASITYDSRKRRLSVEPSSNPLKGAELDINDYIDAITILSVVGSFAKGETHIKNAAIARKKESDRIKCIAHELKKMGAHIHEKPDGLIISQSNLHGASLDSHHDHRMAMSLIIAALHAKGKSCVHNIDCIAKSYPTFIEDMRKLGATFEVV